MLAYAIYRRKTHQGAAWERHWYEDSGDYYLGTGFPDAISAGPTEDLTGKMSRAFVLAASAEERKKAAEDNDLKRFNALLSLKEPDSDAKKELRRLRPVLDERYKEPAIEAGQTVYAAEDDAYTERAWEMQTGGDYGIGVTHTVPKTMLAAIFTNEAAANAFSRQGARAYQVTEDETARSASAALHKVVDGMFSAFRR